MLGAITLNTTGDMVLPGTIGADFLGAMGAVSPIQMGSVGAAHPGNQTQAKSNFYFAFELLKVIAESRSVTFLKCLDRSELLKEKTVFSIVEL